MSGAHRGDMTTFWDLMTLLAAGGGLAILAVMAVVPLLLDQHRPRVRAEHARPVVVLPAQRAYGAPAVGGRA